MKNILLTVSYDGTDFCGWQRQDGNSKKNVRTVQGELEGALQKMLKQPVQVHGSGRTDSGVHALAQAANFVSPYDSIPIEKYVPALNGILPKDIRIVSSQEVSQDFHARFSAVCRTYRYFIHCGVTPFAHEARYVWAIHHRPDISVLNEMASCLKGEIDCTTFAAAADSSLSKHRYLEKAAFHEDGEKLVFEIAANAFLWKMVRSIVGSLIYYERQGRNPAFFADVLASCDRRLAGPTAPPTGLFLWNVSFEGTRHH